MLVLITPKWNLDVTNYSPDIQQGMMFASRFLDDVHWKLNNKEIKMKEIFPDKDNGYFVITDYGAIYTDHPDEFLQGALTIWRSFSMPYRIIDIRDSQGNRLMLLTHESVSDTIK